MARRKKGGGGGRRSGGFGGGGAGRVVVVQQSRAPARKGGGGKKGGGMLGGVGGMVGDLAEHAMYGAGGSAITDMLPESWDFLDMGRETTGALVLGIIGEVSGSRPIKKAARAMAAVAGADFYRGNVQTTAGEPAQNGRRARRPRNTLNV